MCRTKDVREVYPVKSWEPTTERWADQWNDERIAREQRALVDRQLSAWQAVPHFTAFAAAVRSTECPGSLLEVGCGTGHGRDILRLAKVEVKSYAGIDVSVPAIDICKRAYPEDAWTAGRLDDRVVPLRSEDIVIDGSCLLHVEDWKGHLERLCGISRRWVILHRVPLSVDTHRWTTSGYGKTFDAWAFLSSD